MAWTKVVTESAAGKIAQEAATLTSQGALATLDTVNTAQIDASAIETIKIDDGAVTLAKMASESVDEDNLHISNSPTNGQFLSAQSGNAGGLTWAVPADISNLNALTDTTIDGTPADGEVLVFDTTNKWQNQTLAETGIQPLITGAATTIDTEDLTASVAMVTDASGKVAVSAVTATELSYVDGVTSSIQTQLGTKQANLSVDAPITIGSSSYLLDTAGDFTVDENFTATGTSTLTGAVTIAGNLTVNGTTTTISTANLEVEDKHIVLGTPDSAYADDDAAATGATGGGISLYTDSAGTTVNFAQIAWGSTGDLTGWTAKDTQDSKFPIAVMEFSSNSTAPTTGNAGGIGSFHFDSGNELLYIRTS